MPDNTTALREILCSLSDNNLDPLVSPLIQAWADPATALQILEVLDLCIHDALASSFVIVVLESLYEMALEREKTSHDTIVTQATWRTKL